jgi:predicted dehydrogenase
VATVPVVYRFNPAVREARARIAADEAGELHLLNGGFLQDWQADGAPAGWRANAAEGGAHRAFVDIGGHWCDLVEFTTGQRIVRLLSRTGGAGTTCSVLFETDGGANGSLVVSQTALGRRNMLWFSLDGTRAAYGFSQESPENLTIGRLDGNLTLHRGSPAASAAAARYSLLPPGHPQGYQDCFNAFVADTYAALSGPVPDGLPTFADGLRAAALTEAVITSSGSSAWAQVPQTGSIGHAYC